MKLHSAPASVCWRCCARLRGTASGAVTPIRVYAPEHSRFITQRLRASASTQPPGSSPAAASADAGIRATHYHDAPPRVGCSDADLCCGRKLEQRQMARCAAVRWRAAAVRATRLAMHTHAVDIGDQVRLLRLCMSVCLARASVLSESGCPCSRTRACRCLAAI